MGLKDFFSVEDNLKQQNEIIKTIGESKVGETTEEVLNGLKNDMVYMKPEKLSKITANSPDQEYYHKVIFYFENEEDLELVKKHFRVSEYLGLNTHHTALLIKLLQKIERGEIDVNKLD